MTFNRGDVVIAMFPHADGSGSKPRPVLVVQSDNYNSRIHNLIVAAITTNLRHASDPASLLIDVATPAGKASGLTQNSVISCINLATIEDSLIAKRIGKLSSTSMAHVNDCLETALGLP